MERVQYQIERTLPQLQLLDEGGLFTKTQLNAVTTQRRQYEARLVSHAPALDDFVHYANYEQNLFELITIKSRRLELSSHWRKQNDTYHSAHIISIWERLVTKHQHNVHAWTSYIQWADKRKMRVVVSRVYARALALHPTDVPLWLNAASHELNANMSTTSALTRLTQRRQSAQPSPPTSENIGIVGASSVGCISPALPDLARFGTTVTGDERVVSLILWAALGHFLGRITI